MVSRSPLARPDGFRSSTQPVRGTQNDPVCLSNQTAVGPTICTMQSIVQFEVVNDWEGRAACRGGDADVFFEHGAIQERRAKSVCRDCPVRWECLAYALRHRVEHGVWGGLNDRERRKVLNRTRPSEWDRDAAMRAVS